MEIPLTQNKIATIDPEDYEKIKYFKWCYAGTTNYALAQARNINGKITPTLTFNEVAKLRRPERGRRFLHDKIYKENQKSVAIYLHRFIMDCPIGMEVDHINRDGLDNRRANLRICTREENGRNRRIGKNNTSGYHGVSYARTEKRKKRWLVSIRAGNRKIHVGRFYTSLEAAYAYNKAAKKYHGEFASLNELLPLPPSTTGV